MPAGRPWHGVHLSRAAVATLRLRFRCCARRPGRRLWPGGRAAIALFTVETVPLDYAPMAGS
eukprot:1361039-Prymnesium_polylepis.1